MIYKATQMNMNFNICCKNKDRIACGWVHLHPIAETQKYFPVKEICVCKCKNENF